MYKKIWKFKVKPAYQMQFEQIYGPTGQWADLFRRAEGYLGTELLRELNEELAYVTIDSWRTLSDFESFKSRWVSDYRQLDEICEPMTESESQIGSFSAL